MARNIIGLDISDFSIEAVALQAEHGHFKVVAYSRYRLSPEIVEDGHVLDQERFKECLKKLFANAKPQPIEVKRVFLSVPESRVFTNIFSLPKSLKNRELRAAADHQAEEIVPEAMSNLITVVKILSTKDDSKEVWHLAVSRETVINLAKIFEEMGIEVVGVTTEAISSFAGLDDKVKEKVNLLLDIGSRTTVASVFDHQGIRSTVNIYIAGNNITQAISEKLKISQTEAEAKKCEFGLAPSSKDGEIMLIIQGQLQPLTDELKRFINYYEDLTRQSIERIILIGGSAQLKGIDGYFSDNLSRPAVIGQPFLDSHLLPAGLDYSKYINALGLAKLAQEKPEINLYTTQNTLGLSKRLDSLKKFSFKNLNPLRLVKYFHKDKISNLKYFFKNIYVGIALVVIVAGGLMWHFRGPLVDLFTTNSHSFTKNIKVGFNPPEQSDNFILGEAFDFYTEETGESTGLSYQEAVDNLQNNITEKVVAGLNFSSAEDNNLYVLPEVLAVDIINIEPAEDNFNIDNPITMEVNYRFMAVNENKARELILNDLSEQELEQIADWPISNSQYSIISYNAEEGWFDLDVYLELQRP